MTRHRNNQQEGGAEFNGGKAPAPSSSRLNLAHAKTVPFHCQTLTGGGTAGDALVADYGNGTVHTAHSVIGMRFSYLHLRVRLEAPNDPHQKAKGENWPYQTSNRSCCERRCKIPTVDESHR